HVLRFSDVREVPHFIRVVQAVHDKPVFVGPDQHELFLTATHKLWRWLPAGSWLEHRLVAGTVSPRLQRRDSTRSRNTRDQSLTMKYIPSVGVGVRVSVGAETGSLTLLQLCKNYMSLCVRMGKTDRLRPPLNA